MAPTATAAPTSTSCRLAATTWPSSNGSMSEDGNGSVKLPKNGEYRIRVYLMGNDKDADKTVGYSVR